MWPSLLGLFNSTQGLSLISRCVSHFYMISWEMTTPCPLETVGHPWQAPLSRRCTVLSLLTPVCNAPITVSSWYYVPISLPTNGFGYVGCKPADIKLLLMAMHCCMQGEGFDFMSKTSTAILHPVLFGCQHTRGNEKHLHSLLGEGFSGKWSINKFC